MERELPKIKLEEMELLKFSDSLSIFQAACCILGIPPSFVFIDEDTGGFGWHIPTANRYPDLPFHHLPTVAELIDSAISTGSLSIVSDESTFNELVSIRVRTDELKDWLASKNRKPEFFFGCQASAIPDYLNENHPHFSLQLHVAVKAWEAIQDEELRKGKSVKAAATAWIENNYRALGLVHEGRRNDSAIERIATLINWKPTGGAPKTPD